MAKNPEKYYRLPVMGREIHDYWKNFKPKLYQDLENQGQLWTILQTEGERLDEMIIEMMHNGMSEDMAKEVARAEIYDEINPT